MTPEQILKAMERFCNEHENRAAGILPGYAFEHIVLGDCNLYDGNIEFCLDKERIAQWITEKATDADCLPGQCDWWRLSVYQDIINYAHAACSFLSTLLQIPESVRDTAMELDRQ